MERIVIEVDEETAKKWNQASPKIKEQLEKNIEKQIDILSRAAKEDEFFALLDKISDEAVKNGLTEEILEKLLNEE
jgi:FKBP-type peptidyl-prolyl cis-trans isomerase (trigger factor)